MEAHDLADDPLAQLAAWLEEARALVPLAEAMALATADAHGRPSARMVLLRGIDERGLTFFTNKTSRKGLELSVNPFAAVVLHWCELGRQIRVEGPVEEVSTEESETYWSSRPRGSRVAAWASPQSQPLSGRHELDAKVADTETRFGDGEIPLPEFWGGYRVLAERIEFWIQRDDRLHDRIRYARSSDGWRREYLAP